MDARRTHQWIHADGEDDYPIGIRIQGAVRYLTLRDWCEIQDELCAALKNRISKIASPTDDARLATGSAPGQEAVSTPALQAYIGAEMFTSDYRTAAEMRAALTAERDALRAALDKLCAAAYSIKADAEQVFWAQFHRAYTEARTALGKEQP